MKKFVVCILLIVSTHAVASDKPFAPESIPGATSVSAEEVVAMIISNPELVVIDSRKKTEYVKGHIEGAINILNTELTAARLEEVSPDRNKALLFYCNGIRCLRSTDSIGKALDWGYANIFWFRGGWTEWTEKRLPVITD